MHRLTQSIALVSVATLAGGVLWAAPLAEAAPGARSSPSAGARGTVARIIPRQVSAGRPAVPVLPPAAVPGAADPAANIALYGVTQVGDRSQAWLMDITNGMRETASPGETAFGFSVSQVQPESVTLSRNGRKFVIRLGQKQLPSVRVTSGAAAPAEAPQSALTAGGRLALRAANRRLAAEQQSFPPSAVSSRPSGGSPGTNPSADTDLPPGQEIGPARSGLPDGPYNNGVPVDANGVPIFVPSVLTPDGLLLPDGTLIPTNGSTGFGGPAGPSNERPGDFRNGQSGRAGDFRNGQPGSPPPENGTGYAATKGNGVIRGLIGPGTIFRESRVMPNTPTGPLVNPQAARRQGQGGSPVPNAQTARRRAATGR